MSRRRVSLEPRLAQGGPARSAELSLGRRGWRHPTILARNWTESNFGVRLVGPAVRMERHDARGLGARSGVLPGHHREVPRRDRARRGAPSAPHRRGRVRARRTGVGAPNWGGRCCSSTRSTVVARSAAPVWSDLTLVADQFGRTAAPGPLLVTSIVGSALSAAGGAHPDVLARAPRRLDHRLLVLRRAPTAPAPRRHRHHHRAGRRRPGDHRREAPGGVGELRVAPPRHRPHRRAAVAGAHPDRCAGRVRPPPRDGRPHPPVLRGPLRRGPGRVRRPRRRARRGRPAGRTSGAGGHGDQRGRDGRFDAGRLRHDARVRVRPLFVRSSAGLLPGAQAPVRRHEDVVRGEPRDRRRGRRRGGGR